MDYDVKKIKLTDLNPAEYNPRTISEKEFNKLTRSIREYGLVDPILVNMKNMTIIGGHQRYSVLVAENKKNNSYDDLLLFRRGDIGWVFTEDVLTVKDESHEKGLNLALNKISGEWDYPRLNSLLDELNVNGFDVSLTGFEDFDTDLGSVDLDSLDIGLDDDLLIDNISEIIVVFDNKEDRDNLFEEMSNEGYNVRIRGKG